MGICMTTGNSDIKWNKLKKIVKQLTGYEVDIILTTEARKKLRAGVVFNKKEKTGHIILNSLHNKTLQDVIASIAHEITHIKRGSHVHNKLFDTTLPTVCKKVSKLYKGTK